MGRFVKTTRIEAPAETVFDWHAREGAFERLSPPFEDVRVVSRSGGIRDAGRVALSMAAGPFRLRWLAQHGRFEEGRLFSDRQLEGPFARWEHEHRMRPEGPGACLLEDQVDFALPAGTALAEPLVRRRLQRVFGYRHRVTQGDLRAHAAFGGEPMQVVITGSRGLVGSALVPFLTTGGHRVTRLVRERPAAGEALWAPEQGRVDKAALEGADAVVHLAGESIAQGRWTAAKKARIRRSRVAGTRVLAEALSRLERKPAVLVCASAVGFYGDRGEELLDEQSQPGQGFLSDVCCEWEDAASPARAAGIRVVHLRFGVVLTPAGGALGTMLPPFQLGAGGPIGSGRQWFPWVSLDDALGAVLHAFGQATLAGPVNVVAPQAVRQRELARTLGRVLGRPALVPLPGLAARVALGEMADALLLASQRVAPQRLLASGYAFRHPELEPALRHLLGR